MLRDMLLEPICNADDADLRQSRELIDITFAISELKRIDPAFGRDGMHETYVIFLVVGWFLCVKFRTKKHVYVLCKITEALLWCIVFFRVCVDHKQIT